MFEDHINFVMQDVTKEYDHWDKNPCFLHGHNANDDDKNEASVATTTKQVAVKIMNKWTKPITKYKQIQL